MSEKPIFSVSEFNEYINIYLGQVGEVCIEGEISELKISQQKWVFVTVKDERANVEIFGLVYQLHNLRQLEEGMLVRVYGTPRLYEKTGRFSLWATAIVPAGAGALQMAFAKLKDALTTEGLFAPDRKRLLPKFPEHIALITAPGSEAFNDFVKILRARMGGVTIYFYPVQVQGREAIPSILQAFSYFHSHSKELAIEALVLVRGGGSLEDLLAFNDEQIVRAIFGCPVPVISGVGHEGNISLTDLVADVRASTPSNAAELLVSDRQAVTNTVNYSISGIEQQLQHRLSHRQQTLAQIQSLVENRLLKQIHTWQTRLQKFHQQSTTFSFTLQQTSQRIFNLQQSLTIQVNNWLNRSFNLVNNLTRLLQSLDYQRILTRGFSITFAGSGKIIKAAQEATVGEKLTTQLAHGKIYSVINKV